MTEEKEYTIIRFSKQGSQCHRIEDVAVGISLLQCVKEMCVSKAIFYKWFSSLAEQLELYQKNAKAPYGHVNPYAVIIDNEGVSSLLDVEAKENAELLKRMQKKSARIAFDKDYVFLPTEAEEDIYGFGRLLLFVMEKAKFTEAFHYWEKIKLNRLVNKCVRGKEGSMVTLKKCRNELVQLSRHCEKRRGDAGKKIGIIIGVCMIMSFCVMRVRDLKPITEVPLEVMEKTQAEIVEQNKEEEFLMLELAMLYYAEMEDCMRARDTVEKIQNPSDIAEWYLKIFDYIQNGNDVDDEVWNAIRNELPDGLKQIGVEHRLEYYFPILDACKLKHTQESQGVICEIGEMLRRNRVWNGLDNNLENEKKICHYMSEAFEQLEQWENVRKEYELLKDLETESSEMVRIYLRLLELNALIEDVEANPEIICNILEESVEKIPEIVKNTEFEKWLLTYSEEVKMTETEKIEE